MNFLNQDIDLVISNKVQCLYFYASWMPYHKKMIHMISKMEEKYKNIEYIAIDVDFFKNLCKRFNIESIPTVLILKSGKEIKKINGLVLTSAFKTAFSDICDSTGDNNG